MTVTSLGARMRADAQRLSDSTQHTSTPYTVSEAWRAVVDVLQQQLRMDATARIVAESAPASQFDLQSYESAFSRLQSGEPIAYVLGEAWFLGRKFAVNRHVLIPRPDTEVLVTVGLQAIESVGASRVLDIGTGSGCVAISIALARQDCNVLAVDISELALDVARRNARDLAAANVAFARADVYVGIPTQQFDLIVSNPPYIAAGDPHLESLQWEPQSALIAEEDGLALLQRIVGEAPRYLAPGGALAVEHGFDQAEAVIHLFETNGFSDIGSRDDSGGHQRVVTGRIVAA